MPEGMGSNQFKMAEMWSSTNSSCWSCRTFWNSYHILFLWSDFFTFYVLQNGWARRMYFRTRNAQMLGLAQRTHWRLVKYSLNSFICSFKFVYQDSCKTTEDCTAINWKNGRDCILRSCSLPVSPPAKPNQDWRAFYLIAMTDPRLATTTSINVTLTPSASVTTSTSISYGLYPFSSTGRKSWKLIFFIA